MNSPEHAKTMARVQKGLERRYRKERNFRRLGLGAVLLGLLFVSFLFVSIFFNGYTAFQQTFVQQDVTFDPEYIAKAGETDPEVLSAADYGGLVKATLREMFQEVKNRREKKRLYSMVSTGAAFQLREMVMADPALVGTSQSIWVPADDDVDMFIKGHIDGSGDQADRRIKDNQLAWLAKLQEAGRIEKRFNTTFSVQATPVSRSWPGSRALCSGQSSLCWSAWRSLSRRSAAASLYRAGDRRGSGGGPDGRALFSTGSHRHRQGGGVDR